MQATQTPVGRRISQAALLVAFALASLMVVRLLARQPAGLDFLCFWIGGQAALSAPDRLYDFQYVTQLQDLPFVAGALRPYINPPSALLLFAPLSRLPLWAAYAGLMLAGVAVALAAAARARGTWQLLLLPPVAFSIFCGQPTLLLGGLILLGLTYRDRPLAAGVLFALAATIKPQFLVLLPVALAAQGQWRTILVTGLAGLLICAASALAFGLEVWLDWLAALPRFRRMVADDPGLLNAAIAPYAKLTALGLSGAWAYLLVPVAACGVWTVFRRDAPWPDRLIALLGGGLLVSPYAMNYELALLAPAVAAYLARIQDSRWPLYALAATVYAIDAAFGALSLVAALALPLLSSVRGVGLSGGRPILAGE
jgi:hypothetical protein